MEERTKCVNLFARALNKYSFYKLLITPKVKQGERSALERARALDTEFVVLRRFDRLLMHQGPQ